MACGKINNAHRVGHVGKWSSASGLPPALTNALEFVLVLELVLELDLIQSQDWEKRKNPKWDETELVPPENYRR